MAWRQLIATDAESACNSAEWTVLTAAMLVSGQPDPFGTVRDQVTAAFRNAIRSGPGNHLSANETFLPDGAIFHAVAKIRFRLLTRFASELIDDDRRTENKEAESWLKEVRRGLEKIEPPDSAPGAVIQPTVTLLSTNERQATRDNLKGL